MKENTSEATAGFNQKYKPQYSLAALPIQDLVMLHKKQFSAVLELMSLQKGFSKDEKGGGSKTTWHSIEVKIKKKQLQCRNIDRLIFEKIIIN